MGKNVPDSLHCVIFPVLPGVVFFPFVKNFSYGVLGVPWDLIVMRQVPLVVDGKRAFNKEMMH